PPTGAIPPWDHLTCSSLQSVRFSGFHFSRYFSSFSNARGNCRFLSAGSYGMIRLSSIVTSLSPKGDRLGAEACSVDQNFSTSKLCRVPRPLIRSRTSSRQLAPRALPNALICHRPSFRSSKTRQPSISSPEAISQLSLPLREPKTPLYILLSFSSSSLSY